MNGTLTTTAPHARQLARATSDYLAISRGRANFASEASWNQAEQTAWDKGLRNDCTRYARAKRLWKKDGTGLVEPAGKTKKPRLVPVA